MIKEVKYSSIILLIILFLLGCKTNEIDKIKLCQEFYELNKNNSMNELSKLGIEARNMEFDSELNKYRIKFYFIGVYDSTKLCYIKVPVLEPNFNKEKRLDALKRCNEDCINLLKTEYNFKNKFDSLKVLEDFTNKIMRVYNNIHLPKQYPYTSVIEVHGKPFFGIIIFKLTKNTLVYYISNTKLFNKGHLPVNSIKLDDYWYYCIENDK